MSTQRLWLTEPRRKTAIVTVTRVRGDAFAVDRSLFCPKSRLYRHPQRADRGVVWTADGEKRKLVSVYERGGDLWHRLKGTVPSEGEELRCHLAQERRELTSRAHTALHLLLKVLADDGSVTLAADPLVQGGGTARLEFGEPYVPPDRLARWLDSVNGHVAADRPVSAFHLTREEAAHRLVPQPFGDGVVHPGPEASLEAVEVEGAGALPCDGTHVDRTSAVGRVGFTHAHTGKDGRFVAVLKVTR